MSPNLLEAVAASERARRESICCRLYCCASTGCLSSGSQPIMQALAEALHRMQEAIRQRDRQLRTKNEQLGETNEQLTRVNNNYMSMLGLP
jgi:hypothetical protein